MKKSVYSLMLMDAVVEQVDRLAYARHTNRSNMINQILAEYCSMVTPEKRMESTLQQLQELLEDGGFQPLEQPGAFMLAMRSALNYKYNPSVRYRIALFRSMEPEFGQLQVQLRTQNRGLIEAVTEFELLWAALEQEYLNAPRSSIEQGRFFRNLRYNPAFGAGASPGEAVSRYVRCFDQALKAYFAAPGTRQVEQIMRQYANSNIPII